MLSIFSSEVITFDVTIHVHSYGFKTNINQFYVDATEDTINFYFFARSKPVE